MTPVPIGHAVWKIAYYGMAITHPIHTNNTQGATGPHRHCIHLPSFIIHNIGYTYTYHAVVDYNGTDTLTQPDVTNILLYKDFTGFAMY